MFQFLSEAGCPITAVAFEPDDCRDEFRPLPTPCGDLAPPDVEHFFRLVAKNPSGVKRPHTDLEIGLPTDAVAVVRHDVIASSVDDKVTINLQASGSRSPLTRPCHTMPWIPARTFSSTCLRKRGSGCKFDPWQRAVLSCVSGADRRFCCRRSRNDYVVFRA